MAISFAVDSYGPCGLNGGWVKVLGVVLFEYHYLLFMGWSRIQPDSVFSFNSSSSIG